MYGDVIVSGGGKYPFYLNMLYTSQDNVKFVEVV